MGKVRIKTFGDEELEKKQSAAARKKAEAKKAHAEFQKKVEANGVSGDAAAESRSTEAKRVHVELKKKSEDEAMPEENVKLDSTESAASQEEVQKVSEKPQKKKKEKFIKTKIRSSSYRTSLEKIDKNKTYSLTEALELLSTLQRAKFDETVELHINTTEQSIGATVTLPHGSGKKVRVKIADSADAKEFEALLAQIESGKIDFDILIATPETMPGLAKVARVLGPRGLMPNPKNGTVTKDPAKKMGEFEKGQITFKTESKSPIIHMSVGKVSFGTEKLNENITTVFRALPREKVSSVTLKSTMSPGIKVAI